MSKLTHTIPGWCRFPWVLGLSNGSESFWPSKMDWSADFLHSSAMSSLNGFLLNLLGFLNSSCRGLFLLCSRSFVGWLLGHGLFALGIGLSWKFKRNSFILCTQNDHKREQRYLIKYNSECEQLKFINRNSSANTNVFHQFFKCLLFQ